MPSCRAIISSPITKWNLPYEGMIRHPARSHPRYRPSLRRASTRRVFSVCLTSTRSYVRTRTRVWVTRVFTRCPRHPYQYWSGRSCTVSHGRHVPVTTPGFLTSSRRRRRWWPRQWWYRTQLSWNTDNHPLLVGGHPDRSPTFLAHALDTFNQIPHARDSVNAKSPLLCDRITRFSRCVAVCLIVKYCCPYNFISLGEWIWITTRQAGKLMDFKDEGIVNESCDNKSNLSSMKVEIIFWISLLRRNSYS